jgi:hypothetical protein
MEKSPASLFPEVIHSWVDEEWNRSFLILERVARQKRYEMLGLNSLHLKGMHIANRIAKYCSKLAAITSLTFESATGRGVLDPFLMALG